MFSFKDYFFTRHIKFGLRNWAVIIAENWNSFCRSGNDSGLSMSPAHRHGRASSRDEGEKTDENMKSSRGVCCIVACRVANRWLHKNNINTGENDRIEECTRAPAARSAFVEFRNDHWSILLSEMTIVIRLIVEICPNMMSCFLVSIGTLWWVCYFWIVRGVVRFSGRRSMGWGRGHLFKRRGGGKLENKQRCRLTARVSHAPARLESN